MTKWQTKRWDIIYYKSCNKLIGFHSTVSPQTYKPSKGTSHEFYWSGKPIKYFQTIGNIQMWCNLGKPVECGKVAFWEMAWNSEKTSIEQYRTTQHHLILTLDVDAVETKFKQFWKELTCSFKMRPKTQFCIFRHPTGFYRSHHI